MISTSQLYELYRMSGGVSTDTRQIGEGQLYFALRGPNFNGNQYAAMALEKGASAAIVDDPQFGNMENCHLVPDALKALQELATLHRSKLKIPVIGLTGSNGKTTTKELMVATLQQKYQVGYTHGNLNNHIGVPLTLLNLARSSEIAVIEMGANAQGEIAMLSDICQPDIGLITNFGKAHLEGFGGIEGIIKGKSELYEHLRKRQKMAWVNAADPIQVERSEGIKRKLFGSHPNADYTITLLNTPDSPRYTAVRYLETDIHSHLAGNYNYGNLAAAISLAAHLEISTSQIKAAIENYRPENNRSQLYESAYNALLRDYYNANPSSVAAALENFETLHHPGKWVILGDMFELGGEEKAEHQAVVDRLKGMELEKLILVGKAFAQVKPPEALHFHTTEEALEYLSEKPPRDKLILLKGSRGMALEKLLPCL